MRPEEVRSRREGGIDYHAARTLQVIPSGSYRDHLPVYIRVPVSMAARGCDGTVERDRTERDVWDFDRLAAAVQTEEGKDDFLNELSAELAATAERRASCETPS